MAKEEYPQVAAAMEDRISTRNLFPENGQN
jgi:hypothetical protein